MRYSLFICIILTIVSCGPTAVYQETNKVGAEWGYDETMSFVIEVQDTAQLYDLLLQLSHSATFRYQNLYVEITTVYPDGNKVSDVLSLQLANKLGRWSGKCGSENCQVDIVLQEAFRFRQIGAHTITIAQHSREVQLDGINSGTLKLIEHKVQS